MQQCAIRLLPEPEIAFSPWHKWDATASLMMRKRALPFSADLEWPGLYAWAAFSGTPPPGRLRLSSPPKEIVYIGEAKKPLRKRLNQFGRSFVNGSSGHEGATCLRRAMRGAPARLCFSYFSLSLPAEPEDFWQDIRHWSRPFLHYAERLLLWNYVRHWRRIPKANRT